MALCPAAPRRVTVSGSTNVHGLHAVWAGFNGRRTLSDTIDASSNQNPNVVGHYVTSNGRRRCSGSTLSVFILQKSSRTLEAPQFASDKIPTIGKSLKCWNDLSGFSGLSSTLTFVFCQIPRLNSLRRAGVKGQGAETVGLGYYGNKLNH